MINTNINIGLLKLSIYLKKNWKSQLCPDFKPKKILGIWVGSWAKAQTQTQTQIPQKNWAQLTGQFETQPFRNANKYIFNFLKQ